ncbi:MAG: 16S rRNA (guanine(527)-N(7))-methyltransferase RsmG [Pseudomonadota bacterium]|nr:16S rRNA (guanine(527)-N(7))-methyltransferase RsmG [Pseudomonadota bacterium]
MSNDLREICSELKLPIQDYQLDMLKKYANLALRWNNIVNLTGAKDASQFVRDHISDGLAIVPYFEKEQNIVDVGSGNGIPGIVISIMCPRSKTILLEPRNRRARFLEQVRIELELPDVRIMRCKLEEMSLGLPTMRYTLVTRAFGEMIRFARLIEPFKNSISKVYFLKSNANADEINLAECILGKSQTIELDVPGFSNRTLVIFNDF